MAETPTVNVTVNGEQKRYGEGTSLAAVVRSLGADPARVVVERNMDIVPGGELEATMVADGDSLEVVQFVGGG